MSKDKLAISARRLLIAGIVINIIALVLAYFQAVADAALGTAHGIGIGLILTAIYLNRGRLQPIRIRS